MDQREGGEVMDKVRISDYSGKTLIKKGSWWFYVTFAFNRLSSAKD